MATIVFGDFQPLRQAKKIKMQMKALKERGTNEHILMGVETR
jgi:hypothetical protein